MKMYNLIFIVIVIFFVGCSSSNVTTVKASKLDSCPNKTVGQMIDGFFGSPKWSSGSALGNAHIEDGLILVNVTGKITYDQKPVNATLQFVFDKDKTYFQVQAFEINGKPQNDFMTNSLVSLMCNKK